MYFKNKKKLMLLVLMMQTLTFAELKVDINGAGGNSQKGFYILDPNVYDNAAETTAYFYIYDAFGPEMDADISLHANRWKVRYDITGDYEQLSNMLYDFGGPSGEPTKPPNHAILSFLLPSGTYDITLYHHESKKSAIPATLTITDAYGERPSDSVISTGGTSPATISTYNTTITSDSNEIIFDYYNNSGDAFPINGFEMEITSQWDCIIDNFENYDNISQMLNNWSDASVNGTGANISLEIQSQNKAMKLEYDNSNPANPGTYYSEIFCNVSHNDWTENSNAIGLSISFYGNNANTQETLYIALEDSQQNFVQIINGIETKDTIDITKEHWQQLIVPLDFFHNQGVSISEIKKLYIGLGNRNYHPDPGESGQILIDNIKLVAQQCIELYRPASDINGDCIVNLVDFAILADNWLPF